APEQLTSDQYNNWFPHVSPDGQWIAFLSFMKDVAPGDHPFYKHVYLRVMSAREGGGSARVVAYVYGGQGTINVPSLSPDSRRLAFVRNPHLRPGGARARRRSQRHVQAHPSRPSHDRHPAWHWSPHRR